MRIVPRPWTLIDRVETPDGPLELRQREPDGFIIMSAGRVLMSSTHTRSETDLATLSCAGLKSATKHPQVLIGGAGLGYTLRAALDVLPASASVTVAELNPVIVGWCRGPLAVLTDSAIDDPRTNVFVGDVMAQLRARRRSRGSWDAIVIDLYLVPANASSEERHPLYGASAVADVYGALAPGGTYAVWGEEPSSRFENRLKRVGFEVSQKRSQGRGPHHVIFLARRPRA